MGDASDYSGFITILIIPWLVFPSILMAMLFLFVSFGNAYKNQSPVWRQKTFGFCVGALTSAMFGILLFKLLDYSQPCLPRHGKEVFFSCDNLASFLDRWCLVWSLVVVGMGRMVSVYYLPFLQWWLPQRS